MKISLTAKRKTVLKKDPVDSKLLAEREGALHPVEKGETFSGKVIEEVGKHLKIALDHGAGEWYVYRPHWDVVGECGEVPVTMFTGSVLRTIMPSATQKDVETYLDPLNKVCNRFDILTAKRAAAFIAQLAHESGSLRYKEEIASGEAYEGRSDLGNTEPGDGKRFKGRGLIQLTGRANYREAGEALGLPLEDKPETVVSDPYVNVLVAGWFWHTRGLNALADKEDFVAITKRINGGTNGLADRQAYWGRAKAALYHGAGQARPPQNLQNVDWNDPACKVSKYFTVREVTLGDSARIPNTPSVQKAVWLLAQELDKVREAWGSPLIVTSWYRPPSVNQRVGGAKNSQHLYGKAADLRPANGQLEAFQAFCDKGWFGALGYGAKKGFVHLDNRNGGGWNTGGTKGVRWNY